MEHDIVSQASELSHEEVFYQSAEFWVAFAFILVVSLLAKFIYKTIATAAEKKINNITTKFQNAEDIKLKAQELFAEYERKLSNSDKEIEAFVAEQLLFIENVRNEKILDLEKQLSNRQKEVDSQIEQSFNELTTAINQKIVSKAVDTVKRVLSEKLNQKDYEKLIDKSIKNIENM